MLSHHTGILTDLKLAELHLVAISLTPIATMLLSTILTHLKPPNPPLMHQMPAATMVQHVPHVPSVCTNCNPLRLHNICVPETTRNSL